MPYCPKCRYEYREGIEKCPDCDIGLVAELPEDTWSNEDLVPVFSARDRIEADIVTGVLESAGIHAWFRTSARSWRPATEIMSIVDWGEIFVLESQADNARQVIEQAMEAGEYEISESD